MVVYHCSRRSGALSLFLKKKVDIYIEIYVISFYSSTVEHNTVNIMINVRFILEANTIIVSFHILWNIIWNMGKLDGNYIKKKTKND